MNGFGRLACSLAGIFCLAVTHVHAASGTVDLVVIAASDRHAVEMGDITVTAMAGVGRLTVRNSSGRPFIDGASAEIRFAGFSKKTPSGLELEADGLAAFGPEDTLQLVFERQASDSGAQDEGRAHLAGGSGRFAGISGDCRYRMGGGEERWDVTARCEWLYSFPYR